MSRKTQEMEWFGADVEDNPDAKETTAEFHGYKGVDADVPRAVRQADGSAETVLVRREAPKYLRAKTTAGERTDHEIARTTARFKLMREGFRFAPESDKEMWETRMNLALAEMQIARFQQKLARYEATESPRPEQIKLLKDQITYWRGKFAESAG